MRKRSYDKLKQEEVRLAYFKHRNGEKVSYDEFVLMLSTNDELMFNYKNGTYEIYYDVGGVPAVFTTLYNGKEKIFEQNENFSTIDELLDKFRIDGKSIKNIWNDVEF